ncbi:MAG: hypothetical protein VKS61_03305 [Candidatus Sericytochromatia bacterium]|nr:hypothetical protein [Candidatus Sericytochromatia bacterium]
MRLAQPSCGLLAAVHLAGCAALSMEQNFQAADAPQAAPGAPFVQTYDKSGPEVKYVSLDRFAGMLYGARAVRYFSQNRSLYAGPMFYGTLPFIGSRLSPVFGYMGVQAGHEGTLGPLSYDTTLLVGATTSLQDCSPSDLGQQLLLEPSVALGLPVPGLTGWHASLVAGALLLPMHLDQTGWTVGLRIDQKTLNATVVAAD